MFHSLNLASENQDTLNSPHGLLLLHLSTTQCIDLSGISPSLGVAEESEIQQPLQLAGAPYHEIPLRGFLWGYFLFGDCTILFSYKSVDSTTIAPSRRLPF